MTCSRPTIFLRTLLGGGAIPAILLAAPALRAQTIGAAVTTAATAPATASDPDGINDIVVTASRRAENARDVPVAVTAISGETLNVINSSGLDIRFLAARTPSLQVESSFGRTFPRFYIRGLGNTDFDPNAAQPVSVVYDDVALENPILKAFPVFDLADVQVLRGPQGTLFGRNTPAGVVKLESARPGTTLNGYAQASYATYDTVNAEGAVGGPLGGGFSARVSGLLQRRANWLTNDNYGKPGNLASAKLEGYRDVAGRFQLGYTSGDFNALLNVHGRDLDGTPRVFRAGLFRKGSNDFVAAFDKDHVSLDGLTNQSLNQWGTNLHLDYRFDGLGTLYSVTAYERAHVKSTGDIDGGSCYAYIPGCTLGQINVGGFPVNTGTPTRPREFSQELRFATEDMNGLRAQAGAYYFDQVLDYEDTSYDTTGKLNGDVFHHDRNRNFGIFASGEYKATEALTLRAGVRYSHDSKRDTISLDPATAATTIANQLVAVTLPVTNRAKAGNVSWDASATYAVSPAVNLYARVATGYLGPAIQDRVTFFSVPSVARKQTTISGEGGIKAVALDHRLRFDLDGYYYRTNDLQLTAVGGASNSARLLNADHAVGYGIEATVEAKPLPNLLLTAGGSWNFTEIRDPNIAVGACGGGCTVTNPLTATGLAIINGNDLPQAPRYIANWTARYGIPLANGDEIFASTDWAYRSKINYFLYTALEFRGRSSLEGGLRVGYKMKSGLQLSVFSRNITNQIRSVSAIDFNNLTGMINEPRIIGGEVRFAF